MNDKGLNEGWYDIGRFMLASADLSPEVGYCGTHFPIYLTGECLWVPSETCTLSKHVVSSKLKVYVNHNNVCKLCQ